MAGLQSGKGNGDIGRRAGPEHGPARSRQPRWQIHRQNRHPGGLDSRKSVAQSGRDRAGKPGPEKRVDDDVTRTRLNLIECSNFAGKSVPRPCSIAARTRFHTKPQDFNAVFRKKTTRNMAVTAIVAGTGQHQGPACLRVSLQEKSRHMGACGFHQSVAVNSASGSSAVNACHIFRQEQVSVIDGHQ